MINGAALLMSAIAGLAIHLFFKFIRRYGPSPVSERRPEFTGYLSVADFVSSKRQRRVYYLVFRHLPPLIVTVLLCGVLNKAFPELWTLPYLLLSAFTSAIFSSLLAIFQKDLYLSERIIHGYNVAFTAATAIFVNFFSHSQLLATMTPSLEGIVDNIWSSLFVSLIVVAFLEASVTSAPSRTEERRDVRARFVISSLGKMEKEFGRYIDALCASDRVLARLLRAIIIFEDMNRPPWIRRAERALVRLPGVSLTTGIAQVKSSRPLSDVESIREAYILLVAEPAALESEGDVCTRVRSLIYRYNPDRTYVDNVLSVYEFVPSN